MPAWRFAIVTDVHIYSSGKVPPDFSTLIEQLRSFGLRFLITSGDATVGNPTDGVPADKVRSWWQAYLGAIQPLVSDGVAHLAIAGNHDYYTPEHRSEYGAAFADLAERFADVAPVAGRPPLYYSFDLDGVHFTMLHTVEQAIEEEVEAWLRTDLASPAARQAALRLCIGHVPLVSMMGKTSETYRDHLGSLLAEGGVAAYFSGHEHLCWDQELRFGGGSLRQIHIGTSSGTYHFPIKKSAYEAAGADRVLTLPYTGTRFTVSLNKKDGFYYQDDKVCCCVVEIDDTTYDVRHLTLRDGRLVPFGIG
jgi:3',5'-cyclic AMP phosphodiesterase CpdA